MSIIDIKAGSLFFPVGNQKLLMFLCLFLFSTLLSAQIFQSTTTPIYIGEETTVRQGVSREQERKTVRIYIAEGTNVTGLPATENLVVTYLENPKKANADLTHKLIKEEEHLEQPLPKQEKSRLPKEIIRGNNAHKTSLFIAQYDKAVISYPSRNIMMIAFYLKEAGVIMMISIIKNLILETNNGLTFSVYLRTNNIRPPPFI